MRIDLKILPRLSGGGGPRRACVVVEGATPDSVPASAPSTASRSPSPVRFAPGEDFQ